MFVICTKSSKEFGMGHLYRSINLYSYFLERKIETIILLISSDVYARNVLDLHGIKYVDQCFSAINFENEEILRKINPSLWINDRLSTSKEHAYTIKKYGIPLVTFDDPGAGSQWSDLHIAALCNQDHMLIAGKKILSGAQYLILSPEIKRYVRSRDRKDKIVVSIGGSDTYGVTNKVTNELKTLNLPATIILGPGVSGHIYDQLDAKFFSIKSNVSSLHAEIFKHDLIISSGGITAYEAAASGIPSLIIACESWERSSANYLENIGCSFCIGTPDSFSILDYYKKLDPVKMSKCGINGISLEGLDRVGGAIIGLFRDSQKCGDN